jgi:hypothetical protein
MAYIDLSLEQDSLWVKTKTSPHLKEAIITASQETDTEVS